VYEHFRARRLVRIGLYISLTRNIKREKNVIYVPSPVIYESAVAFFVSKRYNEYATKKVAKIQNRRAKNE
jgi:hypothetical protein